MKSGNMDLLEEFKPIGYGYIAKEDCKEKTDRYKARLGL